MTTSKYTTAASAEVDRRAERFMAEKNCGYREAWHAVLAADPELATAYAQPAPAEGSPASAEVDRRAQALIAEHPHLDYHEAMGAVLHEDPALKARYAGVQR